MSFKKVFLCFGLIFIFLLLAQKTQAAALRDILINEVMWGGSTASNTDEWIELRNASTSPIDLNGWTIQDVNNTITGATSSLTISTSTGASTTTIPASGYFLISNATSGFSSILNSVTVQMATDTINLLDSYLLNGAIVLKDNLGIIIDETPASSTTAWPAGAIGVATSSMARDWTVGTGTSTTDWHSAVFATNWDAGAPEKGTPGVYNGYSISGTFSQLNANASGTVYLIVSSTTPATIAQYSQNATGSYQIHLLGTSDAGYNYSLFAFRDSNGTTTQYNVGTEPYQTLNNSGPGYNLASSGFSNINFTLTVNPVITSVTPASTNIGATITIAGSYFGIGNGTTTAQGNVFLPNSNINAGNNIQSWSSTSISVRIATSTTPPGVMTGVLSVQIGTWAPLATTSLTIKPTITSAVATSKSVIINFDSFLDGSAMVSTNYTLQSPIGTAISLTTAWTEFRGNKAYIKGVSLTSGNTFTIAAGSNIKSVVGTAIDTASNSWSGTVVSGPTITLVSPNNGIAGVTTTITGTGFGTATGTVYFSSGPPIAGPPPAPVLATINSWAATSIRVTIPSGAKTGPIFVITNDGTESEFSQNAFFNTLANANFKVLEANTNTVISTGTARIVVGSMGGPQLYYVGDNNTTTYSNGTTSIPNISSSGFVWAFDSSGIHVSSRGAELNTATTTVFTLATSVARIIGTISGASANRTIVVWFNPLEGTTEWKQPIFVVTNANGTTSYAVGLSATGTYMIGVQDPGFGNTASSSPIIGPSSVIVNASTTATTTVNFAFQTATARIHGKIEKGGGTSFNVGPGMDAFHIWAYQPVANGFSASAMPNANGEFDIYVNPGTYIVGVGGPDLPSPVEKQIEVVSGNANFALTNATTDITLIIKAPEEYISGTVTDNNGSAISGTSVFAWKSGSPGGGQAITNSSGVYKLYVAPGTYTVEGFAPQFGKLTARTGVSVADDCHATTPVSCPSVDFSVSSDLATISGTVTKNSAATADIDVWVTVGENGNGINGTRTGSDGTYSLKVPYAAGYWLHAAQPGKGEIYRISLSTFSSSQSTSTNNITINTATVNVRISPVSAFSQAFVEILNTTSTKERGFTDKDTGATSSYRQYSIEVPKPTNNEIWTYTIQGGIPGFGPLTATTTAIASTTASTTINIVLGSVYQISGTISNAESAFVWAAGSAGHGGGQVNASGTFSFTLKQGTYDFGVDKKGYTGNILSNQSITADASITGLTLSSAGLAISGTVSISSVAESGAWVWGTNGAGGWTGGESDGNGSYTLNVTAGTWQVKAVSEGYESSPQSVTISSGTTTLNLSLSAMSGYTVATPTVESIVPKTGGVVKGSGFSIDAPAGALSSQDSETGRMSVQKTTSVPQTNGVKPLGGAAYSITVANSSGTAITVLNDSITITLTYTAAELATAGISQASSSLLSLGYWDSTANTWTTISTNAATTSDGGVTYTGTTNHLSDYAPLVSSGATPPNTPTGLTATAGNGQIALSWSASSGATKYYIYRKSGSDYPYISQTTAITYTNTGLTNGTIYYYKISALNADNDESTSTDAVSNSAAESAGPSAGSSYTYVPPTTPAMPITVTGQVTATAGSGGKTTITTAENIKAAVELPINAVSANTTVAITPVAKTATAVSAAVASAPTGKTIVGSNVYNYTAQTAAGATVSTFSTAVTLTFIYADSQITGLNESTLKVYYWNTTTSQWTALTTTVNTASNTLTANTTHFTYFAIMGETGIIAPTTPAIATTTPAVVKPISQMTATELQAEIVRIIALIAQLQAELAKMVSAEKFAGIPAGFTFKTTLKSGMVSGEVKYLQIVLNSNSVTKVADSGPGSIGKETTKFGFMTKGAVVRFQEKYRSEILTPSKLTEGTGIVGSATRAKLNKLLGK